MILIYARGDFANELGRNDSRNIVDVTPWVQLHDVRTDYRCILSGNYRQRFAHCQATWLRMRNTRRLGWVKAIEIKTDVERTFKDRHMVGREVQHWHDLDVIALRLFAAVAVERPNANLHNALCMSRFQYVSSSSVDSCMSPT